MATVSHLDQGDVWIVRADFTVSGVATDPTSVTFKSKNPAGTIATVGPVAGTTGGSGITRVSAGVFTYPVTLDDAGYWYARFEGTGAATAAEDHEAIVDPSPFYESAQIGTRALVGISETRDWLQQTGQGGTDQLELARVINDVSQRIHAEAEREFMVSGTNPQTRNFVVEPSAGGTPWYVDGEYQGMTGRGWSVQVGDLTSFTQVQLVSALDWTTVLATPTPGTQVRGTPVVREDWEPVTRLEFRYDTRGLGPGTLVNVTGNFGFPAVPGTIRQAALDAVAWVMNRDVENYRTDLGTLGGGAGEAPVIMVSGGAQRILSLPPQVLAVCWSFRDNAVG